MNACLAVDLGAESGRVMLGTLAEGKLQMEEVHRFWCTFFFARILPV